MTETISIALWIMAMAASVFVAIVGVMLGYHWIRFAMNSYVTTIALIVFCFVALVLLVAMFSAAFSYSL